MTQIALVEALALVNAGGWMITQRNRLSSGGVTSVTNAEIVADVLTLRNGAEVVVSVGIDRLSVEVVDADRPRRIAFKGPLMIKQQCKKIDGGGWREVEQIGNRVLLVHPVAEAQYQKELAEQKQRAEADARAIVERSEQRRFAEEAEKNLECEAFLARQREWILGARVVDVTGNSVGGFRLVFDNGRELSVELDGGDTWDAWIKVVTGKEEFDFR